MSAMLSACGGQAQKPFDSVRENLKTYVQAKKEYAAALSEQVAKQSDHYRLALIVGPQYPIGAALNTTNPADLVTSDCVIPKEDLKKRGVLDVPWTPFPEYKLSQVISFNTGLPAGIVKALNKNISANANLKLDDSGRFVWREISQNLMPEKDFERHLASKECQAGLQDNQALIVRGVVSAKETFGSKGIVDTGAKLSFLKDEVFSFRYTDDGSYELEETDASPKLHVLTVYMGSVRSASGDPAQVKVMLQAPSGQLLQKLETSAASKSR